MAEEDKPSINPGYALGQLMKALAGTGEQAQRRVAQWQQVLSGFFDGSLHFGTRTPVAETPAWVTLEVIHGGFATGNFAASGPLQAHEIERLRSLGLLDIELDNAATQLAGRTALNLYFVSADGLAELTALLARGCFRIAVPEEAALLVVAWLFICAEHERATKLIETLKPWFHLLRFYPALADRPLRTASGVYLQTAADSVRALRAKRAQPSVQRMNETLDVWNPLYDRAVSLFMETVEGEIPSFEMVGNELVRSANGQPVIIGGWPCRNYSDDWTSRADELLREYSEARSRHCLCKKPENPKENFARLRAYMSQVCQSPSSLNGRDVGMIRKILASYVTAHGAPGSDRLRSTRSLQESIAHKPMHSSLAGVLADRLQGQSQDEGVPEVQKFLGPLSADEASSIHAPAGAQLPPSIITTARRCLEAPLSLLIEEHLVSSSEVMAGTLPLLTAQIRSASIEDKQLARVFDSTYRAFRKRRSLLLLNLESQVRLEELPWIAALEPWVGSDQASRDAARVTLIEATTLVFRTFPQTILPNKLLRELSALVRVAGISAPLVDELAADIFMGAFSAKFLRAAKIAADLLNGSLYERYYGLDYAKVLEFPEPEVSASTTAVSQEFAILCKHLAGVNPSESDTWSVALNGTIIEQSQILTTHNLAVLFTKLVLLESIGPELQQLARTCFKWICHRQQLRMLSWRASLHGVKNSAYAWRQMIFFISLLDQREVNSFLDWCASHLADQSEEFRARFSPALEGLKAVVRGERFSLDGMTASGGRRFLGWTVGRHWLLNTPADLA